jgi:hypothetical protein
MVVLGWVWNFGWPRRGSGREVNGIDIQVVSYQFRGQKSKGGLIGFADISLDGKYCLHGVGHGVSADGKEYVCPSGSPGKYGHAGRYRLYKQANEEILGAIHSWFDEQGIPIPA